MKIFCGLIRRLEANAGPLTNFEVLNFLRSKGADKDPTRVLAEIVPSEYKVYDYLIQTPACNQTRASIDEFLVKSKKFDLAKSELLNILNLRPTKSVEIFPIIEDARMEEDETQELVEMVADVLPPANLGTNKDEEGDIAMGSIEEGIKKDEDIAKEKQVDEVFTDAAETER